MVGDRVLNRLPEDWRRMVTTRVVTLLVLLVALLSVATGLVNIDQEIADFGPFAPFVPDGVQQAVGFTGALTGFLMLGGALALRQGLRAGWYASVVLLPATAIQGVLQGSPYSVPLVVLSLVSLPALALTRTRFDRALSLTTTQLAAGSALVGVQAYGTLGAFALREEFDGVDSLLEAFYFTLITSSTVGYGDVTPESEQAMLFTMSVVVLGVASFGIAIGALVGPVIQARISKTLGKMTDSQFEHLENHVLVLGYGELTEPIVDELVEANARFAVVARDRDRVESLADRDVLALAAQPSDEEPLKRVKIGRSRAILVATNDDAQDALAILTARELRPDARIVAAATDHENVRKLERAGADTVLSPAVLGGTLLVRSALGEDDTELIGRILKDTE